MTDSREKGKRAERAVVRWLQNNDFPDAVRTKAGQQKDLVDVWPLGYITPPPIVISVKSGYHPDPYPGLTLWRKWWDDVTSAADRHGWPDTLPVLCHHRENKSSPEDWRWWVDTGYAFVSMNSYLGPVQISGTQVLNFMKTWRAIHGGG